MKHSSTPLYQEHKCMSHDSQELRQYSINFFSKCRKKKNLSYFTDSKIRCILTCMFFVLFCFVLFFVTPQGMWKFPGQESNPCHSRSPSCCSNNVGSLTHCTTRALPSIAFNRMVGFVTESTLEKKKTSSFLFQCQHPAANFLKRNYPFYESLIFLNILKSKCSSI